MEDLMIIPGKLLITMFGVSALLLLIGFLVLMIGGGLVDIWK